MIGQNGEIVAAHGSRSDSKRHKVYVPKAVAETPPILGAVIPMGLHIRTVCGRYAGGMLLHGFGYENGCLKDRCLDCPA
jgi:hypothetical protein